MVKTLSCHAIWSLQFLHTQPPTNAGKIINCQNLVSHIWSLMHCLLYIGQNCGLHHLSHSFFTDWNFTLEVCESKSCRNQTRYHQTRYPCQSHTGRVTGLSHSIFVRLSFRLLKRPVEPVNPAIEYHAVGHLWGKGVKRL